MIAITLYIYKTDQMRKMVLAFHSYMSMHWHVYILLIQAPNSKYKLIKLPS